MSGECSICGRVYGFDNGFGSYYSVVVDHHKPNEKFFGLCEKHYTQLIDFLSSEQGDEP